METRLKKAAEGLKAVMLEGRHTRGQVAAKVVPRVTFPFLRKILLQGKNFVPATCCMKFSRFEFVRHTAGPDKMTQCSVSSSVQ